MRRESRQFYRSRKPHGAIIVLAALMMTLLVGMLAFAIDCGVIALARNELQNAADAGALAGAAALSGGPDAAQTAAQAAAQANGVGSKPVAIVSDQDIELGTWDKKSLCFTPLADSARTNANAVRITCRVNQSRGNQLGLFFAPLFGQSSSNVAAQAVARASTINCGPFVGLNGVALSGGSYTDSYDPVGGPYSAATARAGGHVCSNGKVALSGGGTQIRGDAHPGAGQSVSLSGGSSVTGSQKPLDAPLVEPAIDPGIAATVNNNANVPQSAGGKDPLNSSGDYQLKSDKAFLPPGTYYFSSLSLSGGSSITIIGKTIIYVTGDVNISGGSILNTTQNPANCQLYCMGAKVALSGASQWYGVVYAPTADVTRSGGSSDFFGMAVGKTLSLSGGGGCHYDESLDALLGAQTGAQLVQ